MEMQYSVPNFLTRYQKTAPDYLASAAGFHAQLPCLEENPFYSTLKLFHTGNFDIANCWRLSDFAMKTAERIMQVLPKKKQLRETVSGPDGRNPRHLETEPKAFQQLAIDLLFHSTR